MSIFNPSPKCALCGKPAITTAVRALVCEEHYRQYQEEGRKYLPWHERPVYQRLCAAVDKAEAT